MTWRRTLGTVVGLMLSLLLVAPASARQSAPDPLKELNDSLLVPGTKDAAELLCPALVAMKPAPTAPVGLRKVSLMTSTDPEWAAWDAWAGADTQQAALTALKTISDPKSKYTFALKFGRANVPPEWVSAGLFIETGEPALIALANSGMKYLSRLDDLALLCTVEGERLALANKPEECAALMVNWVRFGRMMADRPFAKEKSYAMMQVSAALERLADIACSHPTLFTEKVIQDTNKDLDIRSNQPERVRFPIGERMALKQLVALAIDERGGPKPDAFGPTLGRLTADPANAYDLFPQAAWWTEIGKKHAGWFDTRDMIEKVLNDWQKRWELNNIFDPLMSTPTDYSKMDRLKFAMIDAVVKDMPRIFAQRTETLTELAGVRSALAVVGFRVVQGQWPQTLPSVQPRFVQKLDNDPWFWEKERDVRDIFRYFVPMRDQPVGPRELPKPHVIRVDLSGAKGGAESTPTSLAVRNLIRDQFKSLDTVASQVYDPATSTVDTTKFKEKWLEAAKSEARRIFSDQEDLKALEAAIAAATEIPPEQLVAGTRTMLDLPDAQAVLETEARSRGLTVDELKSFLIETNQAVTGSDAYKNLIEGSKNGAKITLENLEQLETSAVEFATTPEVIEKYLKKVVTALANPSSVMTGPSISASLTDKDFVLYSVGPDMKADYVGSSRVDLQACKLEYSIVSPK